MEILKYIIIHLKLVPIFIAVLFSLGANIVTAQIDCTPERQPVEKVYCYAEKYNFYMDEDAYMNDPIFNRLIPLANNIIALEEKKVLTEMESYTKVGLERQIEGIFNGIRNAHQQSIEAQAEKKRQEQSRMIRYIIGSITVIIIILGAIKTYANPKSVEQRRRNKEQARLTREENERIAKADWQRKQQEKESIAQRLKEEGLNQYRQLRKDIEAMPQYEQWRQAALDKFGRKCAVCGSKDNIEVDHRYKSFYSIVRENKIASTIQAYECAALWDVNNGAPLCKMHHDQTRSSGYYMSRVS